jgi:hypothetical protein
MMMKTIRNLISDTCSGWSKLKIFAMKSETNIFRVYYITLGMALSITLEQIKKKLTRTTRDKKVGKNIYLIEYELSGKQYKMIVKQRRGPCPVVSITTETMNDIMDAVIPYMGPNYDWYGVKHPSPNTFGCDKLIIQYLNGTTEILE